VDSNSFLNLVNFYPSLLFMNLMTQIRSIVVYSVVSSLGKDNFSLNCVILIFGVFSKVSVRIFKTVSAISLTKLDFQSI